MLSSPVDDFGERVGQRRTELEWSLRKLARRSGVSVTNLGEIERGTVASPHTRTKDAIARALGWNSVTHMMSGAAPRTPPLRLADDSGISVDDSSRARIQEVAHVPLRSLPGGNANALRGVAQPPHLAHLLITPLMGVNVLSVHPQESVSADALAVEDHLEVDGTVAIPAEMAANRTLWAVRVSGSCMEPEISAGDAVVIELGRLPIDGEVVVVEYEGRTLVKRWWDEGPDVCLQANRNGDSVTAPKEQVIVIGVVVGGCYQVVRQPRRLRRVE